MSGIPEAEWDWVAYLDAVTGLAAMVVILDRTPMSDGTRMICLERLAADSANAKRLAEVLISRARKGDQWW
ncbi:hypothetical protein ACIP6P_18505 [Streptomyces sp. NPDC088729]|uniref:hypothetical protein n=1 Tax=Streptomyces sp. NPDC088729 TaxID=3365876 RepID=UPI00380EF74B